MKKVYFCRNLKLMKKILLSFSFIALFGLGITSLNFDFSKNFNKKNKINLEEKKSSESTIYNLSKKQTCCTRETF